MRFVNSNGYEYQIRLDANNQIRIDHPDRKNMTLEEYYSFAAAWAERDYFEFMESEIVGALDEGFGMIGITKEDIESVPKEYITIRIYRADRDRLAAKMKYDETMADRIQAMLDAEEE